MWQAFDLVNRGVFMGKSENDWGSSWDQRCAKWSKLKCLCRKNTTKKKCEKGRGERRGKKRWRDSPDPGGSGLSHFKGGFPIVLREWIPGLGGKNEGRQRGSSRESYRYERCVLLPFLLRLSLPLMFVA